MLAYFGFRGWRDDGLGETLVLAHAFGQTYTADFAHAALVSAPRAAAEIAAHNHLNGKAFAVHADGDHGVGRGEFPVGADVCRGIEELSGNLVEHLSLEGYALG